MTDFLKVRNIHFTGSSILPNDKRTFVLGSSIKITALLNVNTATTATITIFNPSEAKEITSAAMTKEENGVYYYTYASASDDDEGVYTAQITLTDSSGTAVVEDTFILVDQTGT